MGKKKKQPELSEEEAARRMRLPKRNEGEMFGIATQMVGGDRIKAMCEDGTERICRIPGKLRKRVWIREGDLVIVRLWDFQPSKADVVWRYLRVQSNVLQRKGLLKNLPF